jgi:hypothetical protein
VINSNRAMSSEKANDEKPIHDDDGDEDDEDEIIVDENQADEEEEGGAGTAVTTVADEDDEEEEDDDAEEEEKQKPISSNCRSSNNHLRCRQCDYEADDLSDLLLHRKAHASMKSKVDSDRKHNSDIENDDQDEHLHIATPSNQVNLLHSQMMNTRTLFTVVS